MFSVISWQSLKRLSPGRHRARIARNGEAHSGSAPTGTLPTHQAETESVLATLLFESVLLVNA